MNTILRNGYLSLIYIFLYLPLVIIVCLSFNVSEHSLLWHGFSLRWYTALFQDQDLITVALHSLLLAITASTIATLLGFVAAITLYRYRFQGKKLLHLMLFALIILPDLVLGIALLLMYSICHISLGFFSLLLAHITFCLPFTCVMVHNQLQQLDKYTIEAGRDLGANEWTLYSKIIIPLVLPSLVASWLLSFTLSIDDVVISYFVSGPSYEILPLRIFSMVRIGVNPEINALCSLLLVFTFALVFLSQIKLKNIGSRQKQVSSTSFKQEVLQ